MNCPRPHPPVQSLVNIVQEVQRQISLVDNDHWPFTDSEKGIYNRVRAKKNYEPVKVTNVIMVYIASERPIKSKKRGAHSPFLFPQSGMTWTISEWVVIEKGE